MDDKIKIYLDYNIIANYVNEIGNVTRELNRYSRKSSIQFYYSPAHLEEVANIACPEDADREKSRYIRAINDLTKRREIRPLYKTAPIGFFKEDASECYYRVIKDNGISKTNLAERTDFRTVKGGRTLVDSEPGQISNISPELIFNDGIPRELLDLNFGLNKFNIEEKYCELKDRPYTVLEARIECLMKILNIVRYSGDKEPSIVRSATHDISHVHYATKADVFVTADKKLRKRAMAVYSFLDVPTQVLSYEEFIEKCN